MRNHSTQFNPLVPGAKVFVQDNSLWTYIKHLFGFVYDPSTALSSPWQAVEPVIEKATRGAAKKAEFTVGTPSKTVQIKTEGDAYVTETIIYNNEDAIEKSGNALDWLDLYDLEEMQKRKVNPLKSAKIKGMWVHGTKAKDAFKSGRTKHGASTVDKFYSAFNAAARKRGERQPLPPTKRGVFAKNSKFSQTIDLQ